MNPLELYAPARRALATSSVKHAGRRLADARGSLGTARVEPLKLTGHAAAPEVSLESSERPGNG